MNPGPWKRTGGIVTDANNIIVAQCWAKVTGNKPTWQECAENAQLIAAAPDLLEALKLVEPLVVSSLAFVDCNAQLRLLRAAIAKAEGRS